MSNKNTSLDRLNEHLFDVIERLKSSNDPEADDKDTIDIETAGAITDAAKIIVDGYKIKAQVLNILSKADNPKDIIRGNNAAGIMELPPIAKTDNEIHS